MAIYCSRDVFEALEGLTLPANKQKIISHASAQDAPEAVIIALNRLQEGVQYQNMDEVCENTSIVCSLEVYSVLQGLKYPADKNAILAYAESRGATEMAMEDLKRLPRGHKYRSIGDICRNIPSS